MFTGIIEACVPIMHTSSRNGNLLLEIKLPRTWKLKKGESVNVDGVCSTVLKTTTTLRVAYMPTTLRVTRFGVTPRSPRFVNLERSLNLSDRVHGHFVTGHCDSRGRIRAKKRRGHSLILTIAYPKKYQQYVFSKGSLTVNGVSLTIVNAAHPGTCTIALIPLTLQKTNLSLLRVDDIVNLEYDLLTKIIIHTISPHGKTGTHSKTFTP